MAAATLAAYVFRDCSLAEPTPNPAVSPQPPIAMQTFVPSSNMARTWSSGMNGVYQLPETKMSDVAKAVITCVTPAVTVLGGSTAVCHLFKDEAY